MTTWDGDTNHVDQTSLAEKRSNPRYDDSDDEYNAEFDQGKVSSRPSFHELRSNVLLNLSGEESEETED